VSVTAAPAKPAKLPKNTYVNGYGELVKVRHQGALKRIRKDWQLYTFLLLPVVFFLVFKYVPMLGNVIAFRTFKPATGLFGTGPFTTRYFEQFIESPQFWNVFWNNVILGVITFVFTFPLPIALALLLNEVRNLRFKRLVQTVSYLPHFMSTVIVVGIVMELTLSNGIVNQFFQTIAPSSPDLTVNPDALRPIYVVSEVWQTTGWGTILYLAALTTIDPQLYEAARIDGAGRWRQTWHVTLPGIRPTMVVLLILNIGTFLAVGFEKLLLLIQGNALYMSDGDVISTYVYRVGLASPSSYSLGAAIGLFEAVIGFVLVFSANTISRRLVGTSLW
jgi:putative aldouronate transport system permease protein